MSTRLQLPDRREYTTQKVKLAGLCTPVATTHVPPQTHDTHFREDFACW